MKKLGLSILVLLVVLAAGKSISKYINYKNDFMAVNGVVVWEVSNAELNIHNELESFMYYTFMEENKTVESNVTVDKDSLNLNTKYNHIEFKKINNNMYTHNDVNVYLNEQTNQYNISYTDNHKEFNNIVDFTHELEVTCNL